MMRSKSAPQALRTSQGIDMLNQGIQLFQSGQLDEAERIMRKILKRAPNNLGALQTLGMIAAHKGQSDQAERLLRQCIAFAPDQAAAHINLGNILIGKNKIAAAESSYRRAIELAPRLPAAHYNHGRCLRALGQLDDAIASYRRALTLQPDFFEAQVNLGSALCEKEAYQEAEEVYRNLLSRRPNAIEVKVYLGDVLRLRGEPEQARTCYESVLRERPGHPRASLSLGLALLDENAIVQAAEIIEPLKTEVTLQRSEILSTFAELRARQGDKQAAIALISDAIKAGASQPQNYLALATWLAEIRRRDQALDVLEQSLTLFGDRPAELLGQLVVNQRHLCAWQHWHERVTALAERIRHTDRAILSPFVALSIPGLHSRELLKVAHHFVKRFQPWIERRHHLLPGNSQRASGRLRIGYLSSDFHEHATAYLTAGVFERHDRERFEVFAYSWGPTDDNPMRQRLRAAFEHFTEIGPLSHLEAAQRIRNDGIDILIDLKGYTRSARTEIFALRPSPIQVNWLGYPGTMGAAFIDYILVDPVVVPETQAVDYDESLAYLPDTYAPVDNRLQSASYPTRADVGLPAEGFVFCSFNNPYKITPEIFERWCNLLKAVPNSVLWLFAEREAVSRNLINEAGARNIPPERLIFAPKIPQAEHLARLKLADLCLDTLPYNAHTTASDALRALVPMVTCLGETFPGRVAASLLTAAGIPELITTNLDAYEERARFLATHPDELAAIRQQLAAAQDKAAYFNTTRFTRNLEAIYQRMWDRHLQGLAPTQLNACQALPHPS